MRKVIQRGELALINQIRRAFTPSRSRNVPLGIGDDCAILRPTGGHELLVTTDFTLESRHFRRDLHSAVSVGHRCLARGLSDLAAMGATPVAAFLSLALPADFPGTASSKRWLAGFLGGLRALALASKVPLAGGDTAQSPAEAILADIILVGSAPIGTSMRRSTARAGDQIYVTGRLGGAAAELQAMLAGRRVGGDLHPQLFPQPRLAAGKRLRRLATACIDLSDGLSTDLSHLCAASGVRAVVDAASLPLHPLAAALPEPMALALHGGEDYELLFTARAATRVPRSIAGVPITRIGEVLRRSPRHATITLVQADGSKGPLDARGWQHFVS